ncbi:Rpp14/Pop5 family protein [Methanococcoides methylutens]|uniref:Ribonuclease P protein component 2 n=1 Tax=Methanococcoides methylutens MM1 TaxID=1434104 RepID=A0A0E3SRJ4_METMT|nr:Rpp14/Pop5 family protein [Methanococcoides methylutens]AKB84812.1 Ribonuclease P protein component 2 [Methanococcoides methylutens MM1]
MKILPPTQRTSKRYFAFELIGGEGVERSDLLREIFSCAGALIGDKGSSECDIRLLDFEDSKGVVRCIRERVDMTRAVLASVTSINGKPVMVHVLGISGTVHGATNKYLEGCMVYNPEQEP